MTRARAGALSLFLVASLSQVGAASERPPEDKDAEQKRALRGLGEKDNRPAPDEEADDETDAAAASETGDQAPDRYTVQKGDTLWGICDTYFHDPWRWPKVWALNPDVTNPHWIFPGQTIRIGGIAQSTPGSDVTAPPAARPGAPLARRTQTDPPPPAGSGVLREVGFVDAQELAFAGTITGSREEKIMLASGDQAYIEFAKDKPLRLGQRYTIYQVDRDNPVKDPSSSTVLGYLVHIYGDVTIEMVDDRTIATATLRDLVEPVERGYRVGPLFRQFKTVKPRPSATSGSARVIAAVQPNLLIAEGMFVVLNRGRRQGVEAGNRLRILRQGDGYRPVMETFETNDERFPADTVAEVIAVDVRDEASVAFVLGGNRSIRIGDIADLKKGY